MATNLLDGVAWSQGGVTPPTTPPTYWDFSGAAPVLTISETDTFSTFETTMLVPVVYDDIGDASRLKATIRVVSASLDSSAQTTVLLGLSAPRKYSDGGGPTITHYDWSTSHYVLATVGETYEVALDMENATPGAWGGLIVGVFPAQAVPADNTAPTSFFTGLLDTQVEVSSLRAGGWGLSEFWAKDGVEPPTRPPTVWNGPNDGVEDPVSMVLSAGTQTWVDFDQASLDLGASIYYNPIYPGGALDVTLTVDPLEVDSVAQTNILVGFGTKENGVTGWYDKVFATATVGSPVSLSLPVAALDAKGLFFGVYPDQSPPVSGMPVTTYTGTLDLTITLHSLHTYEAIIDQGRVDYTEHAVASDVTATRTNVADSFGDAAASSDALSAPLSVLSASSAAATDADLIDWFYPVAERASSANAALLSTARARTLFSGAQAADTATSAVAANLAEQAAVLDEYDLGATAEVTERAAASDGTAASAVRARTVIETARAMDTALGASYEHVNEVGVAADVTSTSGAACISEAATAGDGVVGAVLRDYAGLAETAYSSDDTSVVVSTTTCVPETATASDSLLYKNPALIAWVMNTESGAASWYSNFSFIDAVQAGGVTYAVGPEGLCVLGAPTDAGEEIDAYVTYGLNEFGGYDRAGNPKPDERRKRIDGLWFGYTSDYALETSVEVQGAQHNGVYTYSMAPRDAEQARSNRIRPGKGLSSRYWRIGVNNVGGCAFEVKSISADVVPSNRRI